MKSLKAGFNRKRAKPLLGTFVVVSAKGPDEGAADQAIEKAFEAVAKVQRHMSTHDPESDISRLSRMKPFIPISVDPWTHEVLTLSRRISLASEGFFDVTVGGKLEDLGFLSRGKGSARPWGEATYADVDLLPGSRVLLRRPCRLDLGGIAKGFAVDKAVEAALGVPGVRDVVVNAGGDLRLKTSKPQAIWFRDPFRPDHFWPGGFMKDGALASSGGTESVRDSSQGLRTPILRPGQNRAPKLVFGVSVFAPACVLADALTKVALLAPASLAQKTLDVFQAKAWIAKKDGFMEISKSPVGFPNRLGKLGL